MGENELNFRDSLSILVQEALNRKNASDDSETARRWAIVRTELEKIAGYVNSFLTEE